MQLHKAYTYKTGKGTRCPLPKDISKPISKTNPMADAVLIKKRRDTHLRIALMDKFFMRGRISKGYWIDPEDFTDETN